MLIAHLPASYVLTTTIFRGIGSGDKRLYHCCLWIGLAAGIFPDADLFYFHLIDHHRHWHHTYWTHLPVYWTTGALFLLALGEMLRHSGIIRGTLIGWANLMLHLFLDTFTGGIRWLAPFAHIEFIFLRVPSGFGWWVWNYIFHWSFVFELFIVITAACMLYYRHRLTIRNYCKGSFGLCR